MRSKCPLVPLGIREMSGWSDLHPSSPPAPQLGYCHEDNLLITLKIVSDYL